MLAHEPWLGSVVEVLVCVAQAPETDVLNLASVPEEHEGDDEADVEELEESIEAGKQAKRMLAERNASLQNKVHQVPTHPPPFAMP